jgi:HSP20 family protein
MCKVNSSLYYVHKPVGGRRESAGEALWIPNTDVYITEGNLVIKVELAGMHRDNLELAVEGKRLMISGHRPDGSRTAKCKFLMMEINYGRFECAIENIPEGYELSQAKAAYLNGFLEITVPRVKRPASKNYMVPVSEE